MQTNPRHAFARLALPHWTETLRDRREVVIRPIEHRDALAEREFIEALSPESRRARFGCQMNSPSEAMVDALTDIDHIRDVAFVAITREDGRERIVGACRYAVDADGSECEAAIAVLDAWQEQGLGTAMMRHLIGIARESGLRRMRSVDSAENIEMRDLARHLGFHTVSCEDDRSLVVHSLDL